MKESINHKHLWDPYTTLRNDKIFMDVLFVGYEAALIINPILKNDQEWTTVLNGRLVDDDDRRKSEIESPIPHGSRKWVNQNFVDRVGRTNLIEAFERHEQRRWAKRVFGCSLSKDIEMAEEDLKKSLKKVEEIKSRLRLLLEQKLDIDRRKLDSLT